MRRRFSSPGHEPESADCVPTPAVPARTVRAERVGLAGSVAGWDNRAEALAETAPVLAGLSLACALVLGWSLLDRAPLPMIGGWAALVIAAAIVGLRARRRALTYGSRIARSSHWTVLEAGVHAAIWASLPTYLFPTQPAEVQLVLAATLATMLAGAFLLSPAPLAAALWTFVLGGALGRCIAGSGGSDALLLLIAAYGGGVIGGALAVERLLERHMRAASRERDRREALSLLLKEYEQQGAGWLWQVDANHRFTYVSPRICTLLGRSTAQLVGQSLPVVMGGGGTLGAALAERAAFAGIEVRVETTAGERWIALSGSPMLGPDGAPCGYRGVGADITEARRSQERLTHMASIDVLTGLPNRQRMRELLASAIKAAEAGSRPCAILFLDLDGFKPVNDTFGHPLGDAVLQTVAERLAREIGMRGQVGRVGGDEFAVVLSDGCSRHTAEEIGLTLIAAIAQPFIFDMTEIRIGLSIGCAFAPVDGSSVDELLLKADLALYDAKSSGRASFRHFDPRMQRDAEERVKLENDLRHALKRDEFVLNYQPIVSARTQEIVGFEALLRWRHPERGVVSPVVFVPILEETGLIADVGEWVIRTACRDAAAWPHDIFVSVNLSPRQLVLPALPNVISEAISASRIQPGRLELEVTESVFMSDSDGSLDVLRRVRALGVGIALDDFGTGYSSLGYLNKTIFHTLKIDGSFVRDAAKKTETVSIIRAIVALANSFRMTITAEGVETSEDFERMRELGCDKIQGYLFGRPVPHAETLKLVGTRWDAEDRRAG